MSESESESEWERESESESELDSESESEPESSFNMDVVDAAIKNDKSKLRLLVPKDDVDQDDMDLALAICVMKGHHGCVQVLLDEGAYPPVKQLVAWGLDGSGDRDLDVLEELANDEDMSSEALNLALVVCVRHGQVEGAQVLLEADASPDASDEMSNYVLKIAAEKGNTELLELLVDHGANLEQRDHFHRATALYHAASSNKEASVASLISLGAKINCRDREDRTPLIISTERKSIGVMKALIRAKCKLDVRDNMGKTALHYACFRARGVDTLLKAGADPNVKDNEDFCPIHVAAMMGFDAVIIKLLQHGSNPDVQDYSQKTPLHYLAEKNCYQAIEAIAEAGGNLHVFEEEGKCALYHAVECRNPEAVKALLKHNCPLVLGEAAEEGGYADPLAMALWLRQFDIAKLLALAGAPLTYVYEWLPKIQIMRDEWEQGQREVHDSDEEWEPEPEPDMDEALIWVKNWLYEPHTLQQLGRAAVRKYVRPGPQANLDNLPVTAVMKEYIALQPEILQ